MTESLGRHDWFRIRGVNARNPITGSDTGMLQWFEAVCELPAGKPIPVDLQHVYPIVPLRHEPGPIAWDRVMIREPRPEEIAAVHGGKQ